MKCATPPAVDHLIKIKDIGIGGMETHQPHERALIELVAVVLGIDQTAVQVSIDNTGGHLANRADVLSQLFPACLLRQPSGHGNERHENRGRRQAGESKDGPTKRSFGAIGATRQEFFRQVTYDATCRPGPLGLPGGTRLAREALVNRYALKPLTPPSKPGLQARVLQPCR